MTESKPEFEKVYARDFPLIVEQSWVQSFSLAEKELGVSNPQRPYVILHATERDLEIWEHAQAISFFQDALLARNGSDKTFMPDTIAKYREIKAELDAQRAAGPLRKESIGEYEYIERLKKALGLFNCVYYSGLDDRTPPDIRSFCIELREHDFIFAEQNAFVKESLGSFGVPREYANLVLLEEFSNTPSDEELRSRSGGIVVVDGEAHEIASIETFAKNHPEFTFREISIDPGIRELKGQVGYKGGLVRGTVKVVHNHADNEKVLVGDILVAPMTVPDFLPAMKKAAAFVTDEGGVMCHAAIIARELKKPCVIGTKIATRIFKDGDVVEIDAERGIVRKL